MSDITSKSVTLHWGLPESNGGSDITGTDYNLQLYPNVREDKILINTKDSLLILVTRQCNNATIQCN